MEKIGGCFLGWVFNINYDHIGGRYTNYVHNVINILGVLFKFEGEENQDPCMAGQVQTASQYLKMLNF